MRVRTAHFVCKLGEAFYLQGMTSSHQRLKSGLGPAHQAPLAEPAPEPVDHKDDQCQGQRHGPEDSEIC